METGTGVYYQAMPAVGPDGKNVMKLIPVQKVNGQFFQTQVLCAKNDMQAKVHSQLAHISLASSQRNRLPTLQAIGDGRFVLKTPPEGNALVSSVASHQQGANEVFKSSVNYVQVPQVTPKMTQNALQLPPQNKNSPQMPVNVKVPILPSGHYLQIPPNATVRTLPASALPQSIKKRICNSANVPSNPVKGLPTVVYVSPVNSLKLESSQQLPCLTEPSELAQTMSYSSATSSGKNLNISSASNSKTTQGMTTPMKWVVQEGTGCTAPCLIPVTSPSMTSDVLKAVKHMEAARLVNTAVEPISTSQEKVNPGKDNALVMYNGKVYFVAKKDSEITKDVIAGAGSRLKMCPEMIRKSAQPSSITVGSYTSNMAQQKVSKPASEIIDLCGDDEDGSTCTESAGLREASEMDVQVKDDDSNVIFVSYIPPKSESETCHKITEAAPQTQESSCGRCVDSPGDDVVNMAKDLKKSNTNITGTDLNLGCQDVIENVERRGSVSKQRETTCDQGTDVTKEDLALLGRPDTEVSLEKPAMSQMCQQKSDSELRRIFGITTDLRICLPRTNLSKKPNPEAERRSINKRTLEGIRRIIRQSQTETKIKHLIQTQVSTPDLEEESSQINAKRQKLEQEGCTSSDTITAVITNSSPDTSSPVSPVTREDELVLTVPSADGEVSQTCPKEEAISSVAVGEAARQGPVSLCPPAALQPAQTPPVMSSADPGARPPASRKTPHRASKGCRRVCTTCPRGNKVGAVRTNPLSKPGEKPVLRAALNSSRGAVVANGSNGESHEGDGVVKNPISSHQDSSGVSDGAGDEVVRSSQTHVHGVLFDGTCSVQTASSHLEGAAQPDTSSGETVCGSSSAAITLGETGEQDPAGQLETAPQEKPRYTPNKLEGKVPSSSGEQANDMGDRFPYELFSSLLLDPEEIKRQERIRRLKDLLREKEAALKKLRQNM